MKLDNMFKKNRLPESRKTVRRKGASRPEVPEGLLKKCNMCGSAIIAEEAKKGYYICPKCGGYFRVPAYVRVEMIADKNTFEEWDKEYPIRNPMEYKGYEEKIRDLQEKTGLNEAVITGKIRIDGMEAAIGVCDGRFLMASMGGIVGEKIARAVERATKEELPVILFACSGGARMQEGITSLMQMAKTSAALKRHSDAGLLYISVLTDPTTGGVTASFAMLGDIILAEPGALIGFAGPRVIEQTIRQKLPKGFQRAEFLLEHGFLDDVVSREQLRERLSAILKLHVKCPQVEAAEKETENESRKKEIMAVKIQKADAWERVQISRRKDRPVGSDYLQMLFSDFVELHGDRLFGDDSAVKGGIAFINGRAVTVITQEKGKDTRENIRCNFGMPKPEGYRKALRLMKQAEKFKRPVICIIDTPGAFCGIEAEERGQGEAIARNIYEMSALKVPVLSIVIGEGGSGGALALATADEVWMLENAVYSILSPEGFASILWKDSTRAKEAARVMKLTAQDLLERGVIERIFPEPENFRAETMENLTKDMKTEIIKFIEKNCKKLPEELTEQRYRRFRRL
ncbi:MAG: acetyl-CoA carboxylase carboxyltransferase subunit alpha [Eubacteriales bacterium]|nr:acetyl-CoA carboxylase carboxyltransferase subunit alpha [Eubacteriales bacterium]